MNLRPPNRTYTRAALELWLDRLADAWEPRFSPFEVASGRELYRQGCIRDIGMTRDEIVVSGLWGDTGAAHVVVYWRDDGLHWRGSLESRLHNNAHTVAALYAIEELIADEIPDLPGDAAPTTPAASTATAPGGAPSPTAAPAAGNRESGRPAEPAPAAPAEPAPPARRLVLQFLLRDDALGLVCRWDEPGGPRRPAFGPHSPPGGTLAPADRDALLRLATRARKAGFTFDLKTATHRLDALDTLPRFVRDELPVWRKLWLLEGDDALACFAAGVRELDLGALLTAAESGDASDGFPAESHAAGGFRLDWRVGADGDWLEADDAHRVLRQGESLTLLPGRGLVRLSHAAAATLADWPDAGRGALPPYLLLSLFRDPALKLDADPALVRWRDRLLAPPAPHRAAPAFLRPYQSAGALRLAHLADAGAHPLLADEMGLGKTVQVLALLLAVRPLDAPALIVCPASVVPVWVAEIEKFFPGTPAAVLGRARTFADAPAARVWIASYTQLRRHKALLDTKTFGYAVLDEAQFVKNPDAKVTQACFAIRAAHRLALSGTPIENRPGDLWALFRFLMPGLLGRRRGFEDGFAADASRAAARLRAQITPFVLRRTKHEVARELPAKVETVLPCPLTDMQREDYRRLVAGGLAEFAGVDAPAASPHLFALLTRLRQAACDPALLPGRADAPPEQSGKLLVLADKLAEILAGGGKAVVFSQFTTLLDRVEALVRHRFPDTPMYSLTGGTRDRSAPVAGFQKTRGAAVILVSLKAGGTGVTLTAGDYVFLLDPWWNPAVEAQAIDRVHRIGREKTVFVYRMIATDTIEERIERLKSSKRELFDRVVGDLPDLSDWRAHFPTLQALIALADEPAARS